MPPSEQLIPEQKGGSKQASGNDQLSRLLAPRGICPLDPVILEIYYKVALTDDGSGSVSECHKWGRLFKTQLASLPVPYAPLSDILACWWRA